jgi:uncharacterized membrane protein YfbV (UPF0208 family)
MSNSNGYVTWRNLIAVISATIVLGLGINTFIWMMHAREQTQFEKRMVDQFTNVKEQLTEIKARLPR